VSLARLLICLAAAVLTAGCGTIEDNAWTNGVPREEALEIKAALHTSHPKCDKIDSYYRNENGSVSISADCGTWNARRIHGHWEFTATVIITYEEIRVDLTTRWS
jgi:hypothetical protein